jgi:hypothetical protein
MAKFHGSLSAILTRGALRGVLGGVLGCVLGAGVAACGGGSASTTSSSAVASTPPPSPASASSAPAGSTGAPSGSASSGAPSGSASAMAQVAKDWTAFFDAKNPVAKRVSLLQDGSQFASIISAQAGSGLPAQASAKVTHVTVESPTQAKVTYSILLSGQTALPGQSGTAVFQDGTWKVGTASFCGLLTLETGGSTKSLPAACAAGS